MFGRSIHFAMVELCKNTCVSNVNVLPQDAARPEEDVGIIIGSGKQGINIGGVV